MENRCKFVLRLGVNKGRYCNVEVNNNYQFCQFHRYVAFRLNNKKKTLKAAVALQPKQEDSDKSYINFPIEDYDEYEYEYNGSGCEYLSFSCSHEEEEDQADYTVKDHPVYNFAPSLPPIGDIKIEENDNEKPESINVEDLGNNLYRTKKHNYIIRAALDGTVTAIGKFDTNEQIIELTASDKTICHKLGLQT